MQSAFVAIGSISVDLKLPDAEAEVVHGVPWGDVCAFLSPAYWAYQVVARRLGSGPIQHRLGHSFSEEVAVCLLGGHGIPASVGLSAFEHLKTRGAFGECVPDQSTLETWLAEPIVSNGRTVRYRFARQKARYLAAALKQITEHAPPTTSGRSLRDWLLSIPGIGYKTASWIARNWLDADDVAILDIHILRAGIVAGFFERDLSVESHYLELEKQFLAFSKGLGVRASELDAVIWYDMMSSQPAVMQVLNELPVNALKAKYMPSGPRTKKRGSDSVQLSLLR